MSYNSCLSYTTPCAVAITAWPLAKSKGTRNHGKENNYNQSAEEESEATSRNVDLVKYTSGIGEPIYAKNNSVLKVASLVARNAVEVSVAPMFESGGVLVVW
jgi:hypothetical protein